MSARRKTKLRKKNQKGKQSSSYCSTILTQKDMIKIILSFLCQNALNPEMKYENPIYNASSYINDFMHLQTFTFVVSRVELKYINKLFNECINELSHLIMSKQTEIDITKLSLFPSCRYLKQLYLMYNIDTLNIDEIDDKFQAMNEMKLPCLEILQIHYYDYVYWRDSRKKNGININLTMENLPGLKTLIFGGLCNDRTRQMSIDSINIDLDITELRIHYCDISNLNSFRNSLAKCSMIQTLYFISSVWDRKDLLHSLCLLSVRMMFIQIRHLKELSVYAPNLSIIQFNDCRKLNKLILLDRIPPSLRNHITPLETTNEDKYFMDIDDKEEEIEQEDGILRIAINDESRGISNILGLGLGQFRVIKNAKVYNDECKIKFTMHESEAIIWPFAYYQYPELQKLQIA